MSTVDELKNLANALEQSKDLSEKNKLDTRHLEEVQVQIKNAENDLAFLRSEVVKVAEELSGLKVKHQDALKVQGELLSKVQIDVQTAKDGLEATIKATAKEKAELETKHADLDAKLIKLAEAKKLEQAFKNEKKALLEEIKKESANLEDVRAKSEGQVNEMNVLTRKFQDLDSTIKQREEGVKAQELEVTNRANAVNEKDALLASLEDRKSVV